MSECEYPGFAPITAYTRGCRCERCRIVFAEYRGTPERLRHRRDRDYRRKYGITVDEYDAQLERQGGGCYLCGAGPKTRQLSVDHDPDNGQVRGLLCIRCNGALQLFDDAAVRKQAIEYVDGGGIWGKEYE